MWCFTGWSCSHNPQLGWKDTKQNSAFCCCGKQGRDDPKRPLLFLLPPSLIIFADLSSLHGVWMYWSHSADEGSYTTAVCGNCKHSQCRTKNRSGCSSIWRTYRNGYWCVHKADQLWQCVQVHGYSQYMLQRTKHGYNWEILLRLGPQELRSNHM